MSNRPSRNLQQAQTQRRLYERRIKEGVCTSCGGSPATGRTKCQRCITRNLEASKRHYARNPQAKRRYWMKCAYGMTQSDWDDLMLKQDGVCAICKEAPSNGSVLKIDHDHQTGEVRGLLCNNCNVGLGLFDDDPDLVANAQAYLSNHKRKGEVP